MVWNGISRVKSIDLDAHHGFIFLQKRKEIFTFAILQLHRHPSFNDIVIHRSCRSFRVLRSHPPPFHIAFEFQIMHYITRHIFILLYYVPIALCTNKHWHDFSLNLSERSPDLFSSCTRLEKVIHMLLSSSSIVILRI